MHKEIGVNKVINSSLFESLKKLKEKTSNMHAPTVKKSTLTLLAILSLFLTTHLQGQERLNIYARAGVKKLQTNAFADINRGEAYIVGNEVNVDNPFFFGLDFNYKLAPKWRLGLQIDFVNEYQHRFNNLTNRYVFSHSLNIQEFVEYRFAPVFTSLIVEREFSFLKKLSIVPKVGAGLRIVNKRGFETTYSNGTSDLNQLEVANQAFNDSFNKIDTNFTFGTKVEYAQFYLDLNLTFSFNNSFAEDLMFEGQQHPTEAEHSFLTFGIGYNILR
ncbi:MAG: ribosome-associated toxin RatA of RatAB toxin-antitoxin module [Nonlabens sp.]|jgi:ribosome-associated toxin RatA of RatAB toxin-antitoxin module